MATKKKTNSKVGLSAPWYIFADTIATIFAKDPTVSVAIPKTEEGCIFEIVISSADTAKLAAIKKIIGESREFGNITVKITYYDEEGEVTPKDYEIAFGDTGYFDKIVKSEPPFEMSYVVMAKEILQIYSDNTRDYYGNRNLVVADAVDEVTDESSRLASIGVCTKCDKDKD